MIAKPAKKGLIRALCMAVAYREGLLDKAWDDFFQVPERDEPIARSKIRLAGVKLQWAIARREFAMANARGELHLKVAR